jgi:predicted PurR-regulated permease PerM
MSTGPRARNALVAGGVAVAVAAAALALWELRVVAALLLLALVIGSAMRPGVERLARVGVPRGVGVLCHYVPLAGVVAFGVAFAGPRLLHQAQAAVVEQPSGAHRGLGAAVGDRAVHALAKWIASPSLHDVLAPSVHAIQQALAIAGGTVFVLACAGYWAVERDRVRSALCRRLRPDRRQAVLAAWDRIEERLGAYVRAQLFLISLVATVLSVAFRLIGLPFWMVLGVVAGVVEIVPVVGPLLAGVVAVGVGLMVSVHAAVLAAIAVYGLRVLQDYVIVPRVLGHAVDLPPLVTLVSVAVVGVGLGPALVPLTTPLVASLAVLVEPRLGKPP